MPEVLGFMSDGSSSKVGYTSDISLSRREKLEDAGIKLNVESYSRFTIEYKGKEYNINLKRPWVLAQIGLGDIVSWEELRNMGKFFYELQKDDDINFTTVDFCKYLYPVLCDEAKDKMTDAELNRIILMLRYRLLCQYILFKYAYYNSLPNDRFIPCLIPFVYSINYPQTKEIEFLLKRLKIANTSLSLRDWLNGVEYQFPWISNMSETEIAAFEYKMIRDMRGSAYPITYAKMFIRLDKFGAINITPESLGLKEIIPNGIRTPDGRSSTPSNHDYNIDNLIEVTTDIAIASWLIEVKKCMKKVRVCQKLKLC